MKSIITIFLVSLSITVSAKIPSTQQWNGAGGLVDFVHSIFSPNVVTSWYVSNSGNDGNPGTQSQPWATLARFRTATRNGEIHAGDFIYFNRGNTFFCADQFNGCQIWGGAAGSSVTGTVGNPITLDAYGSGLKPNFLYPNPASTDSTSRRVISFEGVSYYIIKNIRCEDTRRMPVDHVRGAYCAGFVQFGERGGGQETRHCKMESCDSYGVGLSVIIVGDYDSVVNCKGTEFGNVDARGSDSYGANFATISGNHHYVVGCTIGDCWAYSDAFSPFFNGGAFEMFNTVDSGYFSHNTIYNCSGLVEWGATAGASTCKNDTFEYNLVINPGDISYINVSGGFAIQPTNLCFFNNVFIENDSSLFSGPNGGRLMHNFPTWPSGYAAVFRGFYNNGSPTSPVIYVLVNNLFRNYNHFTLIVTPGKTTHLYNGYNLTGGSSIGTTAGTGEGNVTNMWKDTTNGLPQLWDYHLNNDIVGTPIGSSKYDYYGRLITGTQSQGIAQFFVPAPSNTIPNPATYKVGSVTIPNARIVVGN